VNRSLQLRTCPDRRPRQGLARPHVVLAATVALALAASGAGRTAWADTSSDRNATSRKRKEVQAQLDLAKASDDAVEAELNRLNAAVAVQQARTDEASQAEAAAMAGVRQASDRLQALDARVRGLRQDLARRAVQAATHAELTKRIADLQSESRELASHEQDLENLIRARSAPAAGVAPGTVVGSGSPSSAGLIWPLHGPVSSEFGPRWGGFHPGIDIALPTGTPIAAAKAGTVVFSGPNDGYGNFVVIDHGGGLATAYAHQSRIVVGEGDHVNQGQVIGFVGSTGFSTGPHLHFEVRVNGSPQNPRNYEPRGP
jgi:murein DD-endopeptidase MepM/ murein hydrolase activator NlpD